MNVVITAGFDKALHAIALAELLQRDGHEVKKIFVVTPFNVKRLKALIRQRGVSGVKNAVKRLLNKAGTGAGLKKDPLKDFLLEHDIEDYSLKAWAMKNNSSYQVVQSLNDKEVCTDLSTMNIDCVLYAGGGILKAPFIDAAKGKVINAHSGPLPQIRGMNACEWSLLLGLKPTVTVHFIDKGIDTGKVIADVVIDRHRSDDIDILRSKCTVAGVEKMISIMKEGGFLDIDKSDDAITYNPIISRQCFVLSPVLQELLAYKLRHVDL